MTYIVPGSRSDRILSYLRRRPRSKFRCREIAGALGEPTQPIANECARLARRGFLDREGSEDRTIPTYYRIAR